MELSVVGLLALSALTHAGWNLLAKRSSDKQAFLWLALLVASVVFLIPFALVYRAIPLAGWGYIALSGGLEAVYFILLGGAYQQGDLSLVYPLARGSAPLFAILFAFSLLGERLRGGGLAGVALVVGGIYILHLKALDGRGLLGPFLSLRERPSQLALLTGLTIGAYSVVDKAGVGVVGPLSYLYLVFLVSAVLLLPYMLLRKRKAVLLEWRQGRASIVAVGVMFVVGFLLVLYALTLSKVSYVSPVREMSVVFGAVLGALVLREPFAAPKIAGSLLICMGVGLVGLAG